MHSPTNNSAPAHCFLRKPDCVAHQLTISLAIPWTSTFQLRFPRILVVPRDHDVRFVVPSNERGAVLDPRSPDFDIEHFKRMRIEYYLSADNRTPESRDPRERRNNSVGFEEQSRTSRPSSASSSTNNSPRDSNDPTSGGGTAQRKASADGPVRAKMTISRAGVPMQRTSSVIQFESDLPCPAPNATNRAAVIPRLPLSERADDCSDHSDSSSLSLDDTSTDSPPSTPNATLGSSLQDEFSWIEVASTSAQASLDEAGGKLSARSSSTAQASRSRRRTSVAAAAVVPKKRAHLMVTRTDSSDSLSLHLPPQAVGAADLSERLTTSQSPDASMASSLAGDSPFQCTVPHVAEALSAAAAMLEILANEEASIATPKASALAASDVNADASDRSEASEMVGRLPTPPPPFEQQQQALQQLPIVRHDRIVSVSSSPSLEKKRSLTSSIKKQPSKQRTTSFSLPSQHQQTVDQLLYLQSKLSDLARENQLLQLQARVVEAKEEKVWW
jgi:hypothetical protein